ncbi:MAG: uracil-DNA glycosylase [Paludibacteraceae bacterium]|nr:uracil-DNA glycosylase [Paludibacteraceae bacterium]
MNVRIEESWRRQLQEEFDKPYFELLTSFVRHEYGTKQIFPPARLIFNAFDSCPFDKVKVVILGQDPYHDIGQAHGLCFSVQDGVRVPPSLQNIYKEISSDLGRPSVCAGADGSHGNLQHWAEQGVLLLNATLTVEAHRAGSHQNKGWEVFTDAVIERLASQRSNLVFMLWGAYAQRKAAFVQSRNHLILKAAHPSPLSAYNGFFGCRHFSKANAYLLAHGQEPIEW